MIKITGFSNVVVVLTLDFRLAANVDIFDHKGMPKPFPSECLVTEKTKSKTKC